VGEAVGEAVDNMVRGTTASSQTADGAKITSLCHAVPLREVSSCRVVGTVAFKAE